MLNFQPILTLYGEGVDDLPAVLPADLMLDSDGESLAENIYIAHADETQT
jgi:hypothetical protein